MPYIWRCQVGYWKVCDMKKTVLTEERLARMEERNVSFSYHKSS